MLEKKWDRYIRLEIKYMKKIAGNKIRCKKCRNVIESTYRHDYKPCWWRVGISCLL